MCGIIVINSINQKNYLIWIILRKTCDWKCGKKGVKNNKQPEGLETE